MLQQPFALKSKKLTFLVLFVSWLPRAQFGKATISARLRNMIVHDLGFCLFSNSMLPSLIIDTVLISKKVELQISYGMIGILEPSGRRASSHIDRARPLLLMSLFHVPSQWLTWIPHTYFAHAQAIFIFSHWTKLSLI